MIDNNLSTPTDTGLTITPDLVPQCDGMPQVVNKHP